VSPTQQATLILKQLKLSYDIVEHWNAFSQTRKDLFNIFDLLVIIPRKHLVGLQVTTFSNRSARQNKISDSPYIHGWLSTGNSAQLWTYRETKKEKGFVYDDFTLYNGALLIQTRALPFDFMT
jgi:hypothetical protein